ncbi:PA3496 family putative envelope integrity protein [Aliamphritea spongicola]|uniref:PA3496 family putative envelope integrity protein n=1 Tax=Aliamphritea spongicola TaxID=707589 RepID=UPI00196B44C6|nr:hypothetical protein [Aliamphritea spongicola]MBN3561649.1 hypothetical protein [Aliamphritea spongicola]
MNEKTAIDEELDMTDADTEDTELSTAEKRFCPDTEKRRRIEAMREQRELERELREFFDD